MSVIDPVSAPTPRKAVVTSTGGIVASQSRRAAAVGAEVLAAGGNAGAPAIALAERGLPVDWYSTLSIAVAARELVEFDGARQMYLADGLPPVPADEAVAHLPLGNLARTLRRLAEAGPRDFYDGEIASSVARELRAAGGSLAPEDLSLYHASARPALEIEYREITVSTAPGLTAGPTLAAVLPALAA